MEKRAAQLTEWILQIYQNPKVQSAIHIVQLSLISIASYFLLLFRTAHITGLGNVIIFGILFYTVVYGIEFTRNSGEAKKQRILLVKRVFGLIYTAIYLAAIMIEIIHCCTANDNLRLPLQSLLFVWVALWGTRDFWIQKLFRKESDKQMAEKSKQKQTNSTITKVLTIPNILSIFRILLIPLIAWLYCVDQNYSVTGAVLLFSGATDIVDGFIARKFHMVSDFGKIIDPIADKLTQATVLICLGTRFPAMLFPFSLMLVKEITLGITGVLVIAKNGTVYSADWHGKTATVLLHTMLLLHIFWPEIPGAVSTFAILSCSAMILVSFLLYGLRNLKILKS